MQQCAICLQRHTTSPQLQCGHVVCIICLEDFNDMNYDPIQSSKSKRVSSLTCPSCGVVTPYNGSGGSAWTLEGVLTQCFDAPSQQQKKNPVCTVCEENEGSLWCPTCELFLCGACNDGFHKKGKLKDHVVVGAPGVTTTTPTPTHDNIVHTFCTTHVQTPIDIYCEDCESLICNRCHLIGDHKNHRVAPVEVAVDVIHRKYHDAASSALIISQELHTHVEHLFQTLDEIREEKETACRQIFDYFQRVEELLRDRRDTLLQCIESRVDTDVCRYHTLCELKDNLKDAATRTQPHEASTTRADLKALTQEIENTQHLRTLLRDAEVKLQDCFLFPSGGGGGDRLEFVINEAAHLMTTLVSYVGKTYGTKTVTGAMTDSPDANSLTWCRSCRVLHDEVQELRIALHEFEVSHFTSEQEKDHHIAMLEDKLTTSTSTVKHYVCPTEEISMYLTPTPKMKQEEEEDIETPQQQQQPNLESSSYIPFLENMFHSHPALFLTPSSLIKAIECNLVDVVRIIMEFGQQNILDCMMKEEGVTPLHVAAQHGKLQIVEYLTSTFPLLLHITTHSATHGATCLHLACLSESNIDVVKYLCQKPDCEDDALISVKDTEDGATCLHYACSNGCMNITTWILSHVPNSEQLLSVGTISCGYTPLLYACRHGHADLVRELLQTHPDLRDDIDNHGGDLIHHAIESGDCDLVRMLVNEYEAYVPTDYSKRRTSAGDTYLLTAIRQGLTEVVEFLLKTHPELDDCRNNDGHGCVNVACQYGQLDVLRCLCDMRGGHILLQVNSSDGDSCLHVCCEYNQREVLAYIFTSQREIAAELVKMVNVKGETFVCIAERKRNVELLQAILSFVGIPPDEVYAQASSSSASSSKDISQHTPDNASAADSRERSLSEESNKQMDTSVADQYPPNNNL
eukprot:PhF_6_TR12619/c0_g1_i1/m.19939